MIKDYSMKINRDLRLKIDKYFTLDELRIICFDLSIDFDHIPGLDKLSKIVGLIEYVNRKDRLDALLNVCDYTGVKAGMRILSENTEPNADQTQTPCLRIVEI